MSQGFDLDFDPGEEYALELERCRSCTHFRGLRDGTPVRVFCQGVLRYVPRPIRTWVMRSWPMVLTYQGKTQPNCRDYERKKVSK
jgi:hypothetical protein